MGEIVCIEKKNEAYAAEAAIEPEIQTGTGRGPEAPGSRAIVPTMDIYTARVIYNLTQRMVEEVVDRRVSLLEKRIEDRDREVMRTIRRMQARMVMEQNKVRQPWWRSLFARKNDAGK